MWASPEGLGLKEPPQLHIKSGWSHRDQSAGTEGTGSEHELSLSERKARDSGFFSLLFPLEAMKWQA